MHRVDKVAQENDSYCPSSEEFERYQKNWYITLNKSGRNASMKFRSDFRKALTDMHRLHRESGEEQPEPNHFFFTKGDIRRLLHPVPHGDSGMCKEFISHTRKSYVKLARTKTTITTRAMRRSVRPITASTTSGT